MINHKAGVPYKVHLINNAVSLVTLLGFIIYWVDLWFVQRERDSGGEREIIMHNFGPFSISE